jgi:hypothetical protein
LIDQRPSRSLRPARLADRGTLPRPHLG